MHIHVETELSILRPHFSRISLVNVSIRCGPQYSPHVGRNIPPLYVGKSNTADILSRFSAITPLVVTGYSLLHKTSEEKNFPNLMAKSKSQIGPLT